MDTDGEHLALFRVEADLVALYAHAYGLVFVLGLVGNLFVVVSVIKYQMMRNITNYFIASLAVADLLIVVFCLPSTLMASIFVQWHMGDVLCRLSQWLNGATTCTSVYTLVAVTADRYFAICHTMSYNTWEKKWAFLVIVPTWIFSGLLFSPLLRFFHTQEYNISAPHNTTLTAVACVPSFPSPLAIKAQFLLSSVVAYLIPLLAITVCYVFIFDAIYKHRSFAVDRNAAEREQRMKVRVTNMMLVVIISFAVSWLPLYSLFFYFNFINTDPASNAHFFAGSVLRPMFQWLSLANSCINPFLYAYFSPRFRQAFHQLLGSPFMERYRTFRDATRTAFQPTTTQHQNNSRTSGSMDGAPMHRTRAGKLTMAGYGRGREHQRLLLRPHNDSARMRSTSLQSQRHPKNSVSGPPLNVRCSPSSLLDQVQSVRYSTVSAAVMLPTDSPPSDEHDKLLNGGGDKDGQPTVTSRRPEQQTAKVAPEPASEEAIDDDCVTVIQISENCTVTAV